MVTNLGFSQEQPEETYQRDGPTSNKKGGAMILSILLCEHCNYLIKMI